MLHQTPIGDRHAWSENHRRTTCLIGDTSETSTCFIMGHHNEAFGGLRWVSDGSPIRHVGLRWSMSRSLMCLLSGMSVSDAACRGLWWVSEVFDWSPIRHVVLRCSMSRSPMNHLKVSEGLRSGMSVSDGYPIGLRWVSDNNIIFENSTNCCKKTFNSKTTDY